MPRVKKSHSPFNNDALIQSIINTYNQRLEESIFEFMQITFSSSMEEVRDKGYEVNVQRVTGTTDTVVSMWKDNKHIITYTVYYDRIEHKVKRDRKVNNLEESEDE
jgi:hypothetical protein